MSEAETFEYEGKTYTANPDMETFLKEAGLSKSHISRYMKKLEKAGLSTVESLMNVTKDELYEAKIKGKTADDLFKHILVVKNKGSVVRDYTSILERQDSFSYISTGSQSLDQMMNFTDGNVGWRTRTMIELYGEASSGKSQICMTAALMGMRPKEKGGLGRGVFYLDSEGAFDYKRFENMAKFWEIDPDFVKDNIHYSRVTNFDQVELAVTELENLLTREVDEDKEIYPIDVGVIIVDSIMDPLKAQYVIGGQNLNNLQPRQQHLKRVLDKLKEIAETHNCIVLYTNHIRSEINLYGPDAGPQGGHVMAHASDIRIYLSKPTTKQSKWFDNKYYDLGLKPGRAKIVDCGFLPENTGFYLVGPWGVADPEKVDTLSKIAENIKDSGYISSNVMGEKLDRDEDVVDRDKKLKEYASLLYGEA